MDNQNFSINVMKALVRRTGSLKFSHNLVKECAGFINYVNDNFENYDVERCAIGILLKLDSQHHPDNYKRMNMNSCFEIHILAGQYLRNEDNLSIEKLEKEIKEMLEAK